MKKLTLLFVSFVVLMFISCSVENEEEALFNQENNSLKKSYKTVMISFNSEKTTIDFELLKEELVVESEITNGANGFIWKMYNDMTFAEVKELLLFSGQISTVEEVAKQNNFSAREAGDTNEKEEVTEGENDNTAVDKTGDTKGDGTTDSDEE